MNAPTPPPPSPQSAAGWSPARPAARSGRTRARRGLPDVALAPPNVVPLPPFAISPDVTDHLGLVDGLLSEVMADLGHLWATKLDGGASADVLGSDDLPQLLDRLVSSGGKRIRPVMAYLGWLSASGRARGLGHVEVVRVSAALELLHLFALVHDDVMDESASRRGQPTVHTLAAQHHLTAAGRGSPARFGDSIAILLGDLAHAEADHLAADLPQPMRQIWRLLVVELVYGQRRDLTGSAAGRRDLDNARAIARLKSGGYTVERPLELGAAAAGAPEVVTASLAVYGREVGAAFALRDDLLGIWGDPARTGKPAGDDLVSGKPTVIVSLAQQRLAPSDRTLLASAGTAGLRPEDVTRLQQLMIEVGVVHEVEAMISSHVRAALDALDDRALDPEGVRELTQMAHQIAWRDA